MSRPPYAKRKVARRTAVKFAKEPYNSRRELRELAGLGAWMASITPALRPFVQILWAAVASRPAGKESADSVSTERFRHALHWITEFCTRGLVTLPRFFPTAVPKKGPVVGFDASTTGGGAWLSLKGSTQVEHYLRVAWNATT